MDIYSYHDTIMIPVPATVQGFVCFKQEVSWMEIKNKRNGLKYAISGKEVRQ